MNKQPKRTIRHENSDSPRRDEDFTPRPANRMVLCLGDLPNAAVIERYFQERGWRVHLAEDGCEARDLVRRHAASVALFAEEAPDQESGWLTCWKLLDEAPQTRVIIIGASHVERGERRAAAVGAVAYFRYTEPVAGIYRTLQVADGSVV